MIAIKINNIEYTNIASCTPAPVYDFYYDVQTMDGKRHRDVKGKRTNYDIVFYNKDSVEYDALKRLLFSSQHVTLEVPNSASDTISGEYLATVNGDNLKGELWSGEYYNTGLSVSFEKVDYDE
jgi:hypothetical protein